METLERKLEARIENLIKAVTAVREMHEPAGIPANKNRDRDDLIKIKGIGPKIEGLLNDADINNFETLSNTAPIRLKEILEAVGNRYRRHDHNTWPIQAGLAASERWENLRQYQKILKGGK